MEQMFITSEGHKKKREERRLRFIMQNRHVFSIITAYVKLRIYLASNKAKYLSETTAQR